MRKKRAVGIVVFSMFVSACASTSTLKPRTDERRMVRDVANEFYNALDDKNIDKIWQLSSPFMKKDNPKDEYVRDVTLALTHMTSFNYSNLTVIYLDKKLAVTQADILIKFQEYGKENSMKICERIIWLRFSEGWRFQEPNLICSYMPDEKRIEFLTKNIPDR